MDKKHTIEDFENMAYLKNAIVNTQHKMILGHDVIFGVEYICAVIDCAHRLASKDIKKFTEGLKESTPNLISLYTDGTIGKDELIEFIEDTIKRINIVIKKIEENMPEEYNHA